MCNTIKKIFSPNYKGEFLSCGALLFRGRHSNFLIRAVGSFSTLGGGEANLKRALYVSGVGGSTMVGADAPGENFDFKPSSMAKNGFPITELANFIILLEGIHLKQLLTLCQAK